MVSQGAVALAGALLLAIALLYYLAASQNESEYGYQTQIHTQVHSVAPPPMPVPFENRAQESVSPPSSTTQRSQVVKPIDSSIPFHLLQPHAQNDLIQFLQHTVKVAVISLEEGTAFLDTSCGKQFQQHIENDQKAVAYATKFAAEILIPGCSTFNLLSLPQALHCIDFKTTVDHSELSIPS
eukprot:m.163780 g.163780  ORF g.163780 m.163780 type:complete len:182 (+) comp14392_c0_seq34:135-680(+)